LATEITGLPDSARSFPIRRLFCGGLHGEAGDSRAIRQAGQTAPEVHECKIISIDYAKAHEFPYPAAVNQVCAGGNLSAVACLKAKREGRYL